MSSRRRIPSKVHGLAARMFSWRHDYQGRRTKERNRKLRRGIQRHPGRVRRRR